MDLTDTATWTEKALQDLAAAALAEVARRRTITEAPARLEQAAAEYAAATSDLPALTSVPTGGVGPGRKIKNKGGIVYINSSGAFLPVGPDDYPMGYRLETPPPTSSAKAWAPGLAVKVGDLLSHKGVVYKVLQAHTTQTDWAPPAVPSLYAVA